MSRPLPVAPRDKVWETLDNSDFGNSRVETKLVSSMPNRNLSKPASESANKRAAFNLRLAGASLAALLVVSSLSACSSPQEEARKRRQLMEEFVAGATRHMLDRNPATIKESLGVLTRNELTEPTVEKLQKLKIIPETDIGILKLIDESQKKHTSNEVVVAVVRPLGPPERDSVPFKVTGRDILHTAGKPDDFRTFTYTMTCDLTPEMAGYPRITDISPEAGDAAQSKEAAGKDTAKKKKRH